jgi:RND family efflux transporter MFP subunit
VPLRHKFIFLGCIVLAVVAVLYVLLVKTGPAPANTSSEEAPLGLELTRARIQPMPVVLQSVGQVVSQHMVQIRPQVSGMLKQVLFKEGELVLKGQRLFQIETAPFEAALASARAVADNAKGNADRLESVAKKGYVTQQDYRNVRAMAEQAQAAYQQALINLSYTDLRAPIAGRTGSVAMKSGNIVSPSEAMPLVTINEMQPILVQFNIPQRSLDGVRQYQAQRAIKVNITDDKGASNLDQGSLVFIDNGVNPNTGTITLKAQLPNSHEQLWPGQYVTVNLEVTVEPKAIVVPQTSIQTGQNGNFVYIVEQGQVAVRDVLVDRQMGNLAVLSQGLLGSEQVIVRAPRDLRVGTKVTASKDGAAAPAEIRLPDS